MKRYRLMAIGMAGVLTMSLLSGCGKTAGEQPTNAVSTEESVVQEDNAADGVSDDDTTSASGRVYDKEDLETAWNADEATGIVFKSDVINVTGEGAKVSGTTVTIEAAGTYVLSGEMADAQVAVNAGSEDVVRLVFNGLSLSNSNTAPVYGIQSKKIIITLEAGTENTISDASEYVFENQDDDEPNAAIFSKDDLVINGVGTLTVNGNYECGIRSKDDLTVISGNLKIAAQSDGLKGKDSVVIRDGNIDITSGKDGIKSNNDTDSEKGYVWIDGGQITIAAQDDGIQAETRVVINEGQITITESDEGIAGLSVDINGGVVDITAQDDGINAAAAVETEREKMMNQDGVYIRITDGELNINAGGDGIDSNGNLYIEGGLVYMSGPAGGAEGMFDYNGEASLTGGTILAAGNSGMMQTFGEASTQPYLVVYYEQNQAAGTEVTLQEDDGTVLASFTAAKSFNTVIASDPALEFGKSYTVMAGESSVTLEVTDIETSSGTPSSRGGGGGPQGGGGRMPGEQADGDFRRQDGEFQPPEGNFQPPEGIDGESMPAMPDGETGTRGGGQGGPRGGQGGPQGGPQGGQAESTTAAG